MSLKDVTTLKAGGNARFFVQIRHEQELLTAFRFAHDRGLDVFVLGGGSNTYFSDDGFDGLVIHVCIDGVQYRHGGDAYVVSVGAGLDWDALVDETTRSGLWGIENLSRIPGTVGAAPVQNIGAYGAEISSVITSVRVFDRETHTFFDMNPDECVFGYRTSIFKQTERYVITQVVLCLSKNEKADLSYAGLAEEARKRGIEEYTATPVDVRNIVSAVRLRKLPDWRETPTAGSFFKNPEITAEHFSSLKETYPDMPGYEVRKDLVKVPLAWIIEHVCAMKGVCRGNACVYEHHALVIINRDALASAWEITSLADDITQCVAEKTGISIEHEVRFIGA